MNRALAGRVADALLYEGYILYPYRPSVKNRHRWTFGGLYPEAYCRAHGGTDAWSSQTECLVRGGPGTALEAAVRFLHLTGRVVGEFDPPPRGWPDGPEPRFRPVEALRVGDRLFHTWQEAEERETSLGGVKLGEVLGRPRRRDFAFRGRRWLEPLRGDRGEVVGVLAREQRAVEGAVEAEAARAGDGLFRVSVRVVNCTLLRDAGRKTRDEALLSSLVSTHALLGVSGGEFVSLLDPPDECREAAADCRNVGTWPVLVGEEGQKDTMLSSPIILYDYPRVAPESPGDLFDATEIDEILTLRILTLTDEERRAAAAADERVRALLSRTEKLGGEELRRLHGAVRGLRALPGEGGHE
jgi:hydrogenase maturation protease